MISRPRDLPALTGLRFVAAIWVVLSHIAVLWRPGLLPTSGPWHEALYPLLSLGHNAVSLFFVLSGFILTYIYLSPDGKMRVSLRAYGLARFSRLYPVYFACLGFSVAPFLWTEHSWSTFQQVFAIVLALLLFQTWSSKFEGAIDPPAWSLSVEMYFYAIFPIAAFAVVRLARRHGWTVFLALWLACVVVQTFAYNYFSNGAYVVGRIPFFRLPEFLCGCALAHVYARHPNLMSGRFLPAAVVTVAALFGESAVSGAQNITGLLVPCWGLLILAACSPGDRIARTLASAPLVLLGQASYALYLVHWPLWQWYVFLTGQPFSSIRAGQQWVLVAVYIVMVVGVSVLLYRWVEVPCRRFLRAPSSGARSVITPAVAEAGS